MGVEEGGLTHDTGATGGLLGNESLMWPELPSLHVSCGSPIPTDCALTMALHSPSLGPETPH